MLFTLILAGGYIVSEPTGIEFLSGDTDYIQDLETLRLYAETSREEIVLARGGYDSVELRLDDLPNLYLGYSGITQNVTFNNFRLVNLADPVDNQDAATKAWVAAQILGGGSPGDINITDLDPGTATANQFISVDGTGTAVEGRDVSSVDVTDLGIGTATASQYIKVNSGGTALEGVTELNSLFTIRNMMLLKG